MSFGVNPLEEERGQQLWSIKDTLGLILLGIGAFIGLWIFIQVWQLINEPQGMTLFRELVSGDLILSGARSNDPHLVVPQEVLSYLIVIFLLMVAVGVAKVFITGGVQIFTGDLQRTIRRVTEKFDKQMTGVRDSIRSQWPR
jgi:hypothetical protein